jgi:hypothetical protein
VLAGPRYSCIIYGRGCRELFPARSCYYGDLSTVMSSPIYFFVPLYARHAVVGKNGDPVVVSPFPHAIISKGLVTMLIYTDWELLLFPAPPETLPIDNGTKDHHRRYAVGGRAANAQIAYKDVYKSVQLSPHILQPPHQHLPSTLSSAFKTARK